MNQTMETSGRLSFWKKVAFGSGDWGMASFGTLRQIFYAIFLTDVVGLEPRLASVAALVGIIWDAINDPLVGVLTDRTRTRWGRRRPYLLIFSIPYGLSFMALWWAPPFESQVALAVTVTLAFMLSDTLQTLVGVPFYALIPEIVKDYDERTSLTSYRMFFNLLVSLVAAVCAPAIVDAVLAGGGTQQQGYLLAAAVFGVSSIIPFLLIFAIVRERKRTDEEVSQARTTPIFETIRTTWKNIPFRFATALYVLNWITFDLVGLCLPFFVAYWVSSGNLLQTALGLPIESTVFAFLLVTSVIVLPFWVWLARRMAKHTAYIVGMSFWVVVQLLIFTIQPGQMTYILILSVMAGISVSTAHVLPDSIFPDSIEWDELRTGRRNEGIYFGVMAFLRKISGAIAIFIALQVLGWFGYQSPPEGVTFFAQSPITLMAIRILIGPFGALLLLSAIVIAWFYPMTREKHNRIRRLLEIRNNRSSGR